MVNDRLHRARKQGHHLSKAASSGCGENHRAAENTEKTDGRRAEIIPALTIVSSRRGRSAARRQAVISWTAYDKGRDPRWRRL